MMCMYMYMLQYMPCTDRVVCCALYMHSLVLLCMFFLIDLVGEVSLSAGSNTDLSTIHWTDCDVGNVTQHLPPGGSSTPIGEHHLCRTNTHKHSENCLCERPHMLAPQRYMVHV